MTKFKLKRVYDEVSEDDGYRVLVDRLWPRGVSKDKAELGEWCRDVAPSDGLRKWFGHDPAKYDEFKKRYESELRSNAALAPAVAGWEKHAVVTLLYGAHDEQHNQAVVLREFLEK